MATPVVGGNGTIVECHRVRSRRDVTGERGHMDWFEELTGFAEDGYASTQQRPEVRGDRLHSRANGRHWGIGRLETPTLAELRQRAQATGGVPGRLTVQAIAADARALHAHPQNSGALFQVASQFNLLEMTHYDVAPEHGVTRYQHDHTQGPACAIAAGAATLFRNYLVPLDGELGQSRARQFNTLADVTAALGPDLIEMRNGYALCSQAQLQHINQRLAALDETAYAALQDLLRIGLHWDVEVTIPGEGQGQSVSQAFCSALPVAYSPVRSASWQALACLVLEAAYEATLWAAVLNAQRGQSRNVYLTQLGGGAFGNHPDWILQAMERALARVADQDLTVHLVSYRNVPPELAALARRYCQ